MGARILVADDSVTIQKVVELTFSKEDFLLIQARTGEEAIRKAKDERPDLVLLDLVMPDKNGYEVCEALRADPALRAVPVILLAGTFEAFDKERASAAGANDFVSKPFESQVLVSKVKQLLFARAMEAGARPGPAIGAEAAAQRTLIVPSPLVQPPRSPEPEPARPAEASQDQLWQLLDASGAAAQPQPGPATSGDAPDLSALEAAGLDLDLLPEQPAGGGPRMAGGEMEVLPMPGSLSLDDLLGSEIKAAAAPAAAETPPVFELPDDLPGLPMAEAREAATPVEEQPASAAELDFASLTEDLKPGPLSLEAEMAAPAAETPALELVLDEPGASAEPVATLEESPAAEAATAEELALPLEPPAATAAPAAGPDLEAMRRAVAGRVAEQLAKELSQKLMERIERVVWEVVPDLAEILITKEIERIRQLADEQKSS